MNRLISDFRGRITHLAFSDNGLDTKLPLINVKLKIAKSLFKALQSGPSLGLLGPSLNAKIGASMNFIRSKDDLKRFEKRMKQEAQQMSMVLGQGHRIQSAASADAVAEATSLDENEITPQQCHSSAFIRDHFLVFKDGDRTVIFDNCYRTDEDRPNPRLLEMLNSFDCDVVAAKFNLAGGDVLVADSLVLVGRRTVKELLLVIPDNTLMKVGDEFDSTVFCPCPVAIEVPSPLYHLDLYLTVLGEKEGVIHVAIGRIHIWQNGIGWVPNTRDDGSKLLQDYLDAVRNNLENHGRFKITDWPLLFEVVGGKPRLYTYNNCLVEQINEDVTRLWLPSYVKGSVKGERKFSQIEQDFKRLISKKFEVLWIEGCFHDEVAAKASLRCLTQVLRRSVD